MRWLIPAFHPILKSRQFRPDDKNVIMDVLCHTADGTEFIVEMQRKKKQSFKNRMLYYGASMLHFLKWGSMPRPCRKLRNCHWAK